MGLGHDQRPGSRTDGFKVAHKKPVIPEGGRNRKISVHNKKQFICKSEIHL
jgi:hypothetical protein